MWATQWGRRDGGVQTATGLFVELPQGRGEDLPSSHGWNPASADAPPVADERELCSSISVHVQIAQNQSARRESGRGRLGEARGASGASDTLAHDAVVATRTVPIAKCTGHPLLCVFSCMQVITK